MFGSTKYFGDPSSFSIPFSSSGFRQPCNTGGNIFAPNPVGTTGTSSGVFGRGSQSAPSTQASGNTMPASGFGTQVSQVGAFRESSRSPSSSPFGCGQTGNTSNNPSASNPFGIIPPFGTRTGSFTSTGTSDGVFGATQSASPFSSSTPFGAPSPQGFSNILPGFKQPYAPGFSSQLSPVGFWLFVPFGSTYTPAFGAASTPTFGAQHLFGAPTTSGSAAFLRWGSRVAPYSPTTDSDEGVVQSITGMPVYGDKTHEELRWLDYQLGNKGGSVPAGGSSFPLSSTLSNSFSHALFDGFAPFAPQTSVISTSPNVFTTSPNVFRTSNNVFPTSPNVFTTSPLSPSAFGQTSFSSLFSPSATSPFEFPAPTQPSQPAFGIPTATVRSSHPAFSDASGVTFGRPHMSGVTFGRPPTPAFGDASGVIFGRPSTSGVTFGRPPTPDFSDASDVNFGRPLTPAFSDASGVTFGRPPTPAFGDASGVTFGCPPTPAFGSRTSPTFGSTEAAFGVSSAPLCPSGEAFGASSTPGFGSSNSAFGISSNAAFGASSTPGAGSSNSVFGTSCNPAFGSSSAPGSGPSSSPSFSFSSAPVFGQSSSTFGSSQFGASSPFGAQSSQSEVHSTTFGCTSFGQSAFGGQQHGGSRVVAYAATPGPDCGGEAAGILEAMSAMEAYKDKSHEELRWGDYQSGDKGGPAPLGGCGFGVSTSQTNPLNPASSFSRASTSAFNTTPSANIFAPKTPSFSSMFAVPAPAPSSTSTVNSGSFSFTPSTAQTGGTTGLTTTPFGHADIPRTDTSPLEGRSFIL